MQQERKLLSWQPLWWLSAITIAVLLKHHYSIATVDELQWILRPLAMLLEWFSGHHFQQDNNQEWVSISADIRLVKGCAGINFMVMSFLAYVWILRPDRNSTENIFIQTTGQLLLLSAAFIAAWATCLLGNSLRIIVAMTAASQNWQLELIGFDEQQLHRLIGMLIYVPLLSLQIRLGNRDKRSNAVWLAPVALYLLLMVLVPLLTGNALQNPAMFLEHSTPVVILALLALLGLALKRYKKKHCDHSGKGVRSL